MRINKETKTKDVYGFLWGGVKRGAPPRRWHFNVMQEQISQPVVRGRIGIDVGSGCGYDTYIMAKSNPGVKIVSLDISDGVHKTKELVFGLKNVWIIKGSALDLPIKNDVFDFTYSFGVLHHTSNPKKGFSEIARTLKRGSPAFLYLYEDHSGNAVKKITIKIIRNLRKMTVKLPLKILYVLSWALSPFVFIAFSIPAKILMKFKKTRCVADRIPFNFGISPFSLRGDLYDRFSAPIEHRFSRQEVHDTFRESNFRNINITGLKDRAGWMAWGYKNNV